MNNCETKSRDLEPRETLSVFNLFLNERESNVNRIIYERRVRI